MIALTIDGAVVRVPEGTSLLEAARAAGAHVPTLCDSDHLSPHGACRLCVVEVAGRDPVASCHTSAVAGMVVHTQSERLLRLRRNIVELIVSDHPLDCLGCVANNRCELQAVAAELGFREVRYPPGAAHAPEPDRSHPFLAFDMDKCVACARCARVCDEVQGSFVLAMSGRGFAMGVIAGDDTGLAEAECASCGACAVECPVGAIVDTGQLDAGFPDRIVTTTCNFCAVGCLLDAHVVGDAITMITPSDTGSANRGHACVKGRFAHAYARSPERLTSPLLRGDDGELHPVDWDTALDFVAERLEAVRDSRGESGFASIFSSRCTNEEAFLMQKFTRLVMGTNSIDNCSRVCHSPSAFGLGKALGTGAGTGSFEDVEHTDLVLLIGCNPTEAHPVFGSRIKQAVLGGAKLIAIDPRNTELARIADIHLPLNPGSNVAVVNALCHVVVAEGLIDRAFIDAHCEGFESLWPALEGCTPEWAEALSGVAADDIRAAARLYAAQDRSMILWGLGVTEAAHGSNAVFGLINLALMTGNLGRVGTGTSPIRGQNNVQGASDAGALPTVYSDYRSIADPGARQEHARVWGDDLPTGKGLTIPDMFEAAHAGTLRALWITGEDVAQSDPNTGHVVGALQALDLLIVQDIFLCETARYADVVFPAALHLEKEGTFVNSDRRIQRVRQVIPPLAGTKPDGEIYQLVAERMGADLGFGSPPEPAAVTAEMARLSPLWRGVSYDRLEAPGAFIQWPCRSADDPGTAVVHADGEFLRGRGLFTPVYWQPPAETPDDEYPFYLTTGRQLFHYNVGTQTRRTPVVQLDRAARERVRIHPDDAARLGIDDRTAVRVVSRRAEVAVEAEISTLTQPGTVFMTFHFPEARTNALLSSAADEHTQCPEYKVSAVRIERG